ncbi:MAG: hypothetical protein EBT35_11950 [Alphaproteobacteria bacterium]|nr:hypothetical protein [Alphaproteobacteria bacterium]
MTIPDPALEEHKRNIADKKDSITVLIARTIAFFYPVHKRWGALFFVCDGEVQSVYPQGPKGAVFGG